LRVAIERARREGEVRVGGGGVGEAFDADGAGLV